MNPKGEVSLQATSCITGISMSASCEPVCAVQIIETSESNEPLTFEVGAGEIMGNKMFQVQPILDQETVSTLVLLSCSILQL